MNIVSYDTDSIFIQTTACSNTIVQQCKGPVNVNSSWIMCQYATWYTFIRICIILIHSYIHELINSLIHPCIPVFSTKEARSKYKLCIPYQCYWNRSRTALNCYCKDTASCNGCNSLQWCINSTDIRAVSDFPIAHKL